jgi:hypothetical protein
MVGSTWSVLSEQNHPFLLRIHRAATALGHPESVDRLVLASPGLSDDRAANLMGALTLSEMARERGIAEVIEHLVSSRTLLAAPSPASQQRLRTIYTENATYS